MNKRTYKIIICILTAVTTLSLLDFGGSHEVEKEIHLQCNSLVYANVSNRYSNANVMTREEQEEAERKAEEADTEEEAGFIRTDNPEVFNIDDYTITARANYEEIAEKVRGDEDPDDGKKENYDGKYVWTKDTITRVYALPNTSSKVIVNYRKGTKLIRMSYSGEWSYIRLSKNRKGYVLSKAVSSKKVNSPTPTPKQSRYYYPQPKKNVVYATCSLNTRSGPGITYSKISTLRTGTEIVVASTTGNGWIKSDKGWYVKKDLCVNYPLTATGKKATPTPTPRPSRAQIRYMKLSGFVKYVSGYVGCRYVYGGSSPSGFDCSGFTMYCYRKYYGISLPHGANMQMHRGRKVSLSALQKGDLIFFDHDHNGKADHVGIYVGNGKLVHASNPRSGVIKVSLSGKKDLLAARRYI